MPATYPPGQTTVTPSSPSFDAPYGPSGLDRLSADPPTSGAASSVTRRLVVSGQCPARVDSIRDVAPVRHVVPGGGVEFEFDPTTGHTAWRVAGRWARVDQARRVAGDDAVDRILRATVARLRAEARDADAEERDRLRRLAAAVWAGRRVGADADEAEQPRLF